MRHRCKNWLLWQHIDMNWWPTTHEPPILWCHHQKKRETTIPIEELHCAIRSPSPWTNSWDLNEMKCLGISVGLTFVRIVLEAWCGTGVEAHVEQTRGVFYLHPPTQHALDHKIVAWTTRYKNLWNEGVLGSFFDGAMEYLNNVWCSPLDIGMLQATTIENI